MAGSLREFGQGEVLFRKGDVSDSMYAIISGQLEVLDSQTDTEAPAKMQVHQLIQRLGVGDVVGEMGLLRSVPRMATVIGKKPGELLQINMKMIKRLQWLFPPTAHRFFFNLMNILCDRLESATHCLTELSLEDDLTKFCNRRGFIKVLDAETYRAHRFDEDLTMLMMSVDFDKDIQTFALLMPRTPKDRAEVVCERLRRTLKMQRFESNGVRARVAIELVEVGRHPDVSIPDLIRTASEKVARAERV